MINASFVLTHIMEDMDVITKIVLGREIAKIQTAIIGFLETLIVIFVLIIAQLYIQIVIIAQLIILRRNLLVLSTKIHYKFI
tara:strand:+ start:56 stop:301 length:246 start_codon:yes stop_codon:yes gene_type:complete